MKNRIQVTYLIFIGMVALLILTLLILFADSKEREQKKEVLVQTETLTNNENTEDFNEEIDTTFGLPYIVDGGIYDMQLYRDGQCFDEGTMRYGEECLTNIETNETIEAVILNEDYISLKYIGFYFPARCKKGEDDIWKVDILGTTSMSLDKEYEVYYEEQNIYSRILLTESGYAIEDIEIEGELETTEYVYAIESSTDEKIIFNKYYLGTEEYDSYILTYTGEKTFTLK